MNNIYNVTSLVNGQVYIKDDIIKYNGSYNGMTVTGFLYCTVPHTAGASLTAANWGGFENFNGTPKPKFLWTPDYSNSNTNEPRVRKITLGDGYEIRAKDGINNLLLKQTVSFENRTLDEATAILHFLTARAGKESFVYYNRPPYSYQKLYVCENWSDVEGFSNAFSISAEFQEKVN